REQEVLSLIEQGKLAAARIGDSYRIARIAIDDFIAQR
ncbi:MAG: helix-turn-helix domain-containing protein, partial [Anaerolineae bacterium]|nr:helix-turn-helix domain-containing protein [Anaerolineae bacterium]